MTDLAVLCNIRSSQFPHHGPIRIPGIILLFLCRLDSLAHFAWASHCHRKGRDVFGDDRACSDCAALANGDSREDHDVPTDPAVIADLDRLAKLDELAPGQNTCLMASREDPHVRTHLHSISDDHQGGIKDGQAVVESACMSHRSTGPEAKPVIDSTYFQFKKQSRPMTTLHP